MTSLAKCQMCWRFTCKGGLGLHVCAVLIWNTFLKKEGVPPVIHTFHLKGQKCWTVDPHLRLYFIFLNKLDAVLFVKNLFLQFWVLLMHLPGKQEVTVGAHRHTSAFWCGRSWETQILWHAEEKKKWLFVTGEWSRTSSGSRWSSIPNGSRKPIAEASASKSDKTGDPKL